jgi:hypothetical protein
MIDLMELLNRFLDTLITGSAGAIIALISVAISNRANRQREEREYTRRQQETDADRRERFELARRDALITHLRDVLLIIRESKAAIVRLVYPIMMDNWIVPDPQWQSDFGEARSRIDSAIESVRNIESGAIPHATTQVIIQNEGVFTGIPRLVGYSELDHRMNVAERKITEMLYQIYNADNSPNPIT